MRAFVIAAVASLVVVGLVVGIFFLLQGRDGLPGPREPGPAPGVAGPGPVKAPPKEPVLPDAVPPEIQPVPVRGFVLSPEKKPLEGVRVLVLHRLGGPASSSRRRVGEYRTEADGGFHVGPVPPGTYQFVARDPRYTPGHVQKIVPEGIDEVVVEIVLTQGNTITGRVTDRAGRPIPGALLEAYKDIGKKGMTLQEAIIGIIDLPRLVNEPAIEARTDADGRYAIHGLEARDYTIRASARGFQPEEKAHIEAGRSGVDFELDRGGTVSGIVVAASDGIPVAGARVSAYYVRRTRDLIKIIQDRSRPPLAVAETDSGGRFAFETLGRGTYNFLANAEGFQETVLDGIDIAGGGDEAIRIRMPRGLRLAGRVLDPDGGPVEGARVKAQAMGRRPQETYVVRFADDGIRTGADGRFLFDTLSDSNYSIIVSHEAYAPVQLRDQRPGDREIEIRLDPGAQIEGHVMDAETGQPIAEARVSVRDVSDVSREAFTDADGRYRVTGLSESRRRERMVNVEASGYARISNRPVQIQAGKLTSGVDFELQRTGGVSGVVINEAGQPVMGARVFVRRKEREGAVARNLGSGVTRGDGRFRLFSIEPGPGTVITVEHSMYLDAESEPFEITPAMEIADLRIVMAAGGGVSGRVVDEAGRPIEGATVKAQPVAEGLDVNFLVGKRVVRTDAAGAFRIGGLEADTYVVAAQAQGYLTRAVTGIQVSPGRTATDVEIALAPGSILAGRVVDPAGAPLQGAMVTVIDSSEGSRKERRTTNAQGEFRFDGLGGEPVEVEVRLKGYQTARQESVPVNREDLEFVLERLGALRGTALDDAGQPVTAYSVRPERVDGGAGTGERLRAITASNPDGAFEYADLPAGSYRVFIRAPGYAGVTFEDVQVRAGLVTELPDAVLGEGGVVDGRVLDPSGRPVEGARVSVVGGVSKFFRPARPSGAGAGVISRVTTGPDGYFRFKGLRDGVVKLSIQHPDYVTAQDDGIDVTLGSDARGREIRLELGGEIVGIVADGSGRPKPGASVYLQAGDGRSVDRQMTDDQGRFRFGGLASGAYVVRVHEFARKPGEGPRGSAVNVELAPGGSAEVRLDLRR